MEEKLDMIVEEVKSTNVIIAELKDNVDTLLELNREQKQINDDVSILLKDMSVTLASVRKDIDKIVNKDISKDYKRAMVM